MVGNSIFSPLDASHLQIQGLLGLVSNGTRKLHKSLLDAYSDSDNQLSSVGIQFQFTDMKYDFVTIPDQLVSRATLEYIGFSEEKALSMWVEWKSRATKHQTGESSLSPIDWCKSFEDFFTGTFETEIDAGANHDDEQWERVMVIFGLSDETRQAILNPRFKELYPEYSCAAWAKHKALLWYSGLQSIQRASTDRDTALKLTTINHPEDPHELDSLSQLLEAEVFQAKNTTSLTGTSTDCVTGDLVGPTIQCASQ